MTSANQKLAKELSRIEAQDLAAEFYRDKLVDWMISHDIPTGSNALTFEELLEVVGEHIATLQQQRIHGE